MLNYLLMSRPRREQGKKTSKLQPNSENKTWDSYQRCAAFCKFLRFLAIGRRWSGSLRKWSGDLLFTNCKWIALWNIHTIFMIVPYKNNNTNLKSLYLSIYVSTVFFSVRIFYVCGWRVKEICTDNIWSYSLHHIEWT